MSIKKKIDTVLNEQAGMTTFEITSGKDTFTMDIKNSDMKSFIKILKNNKIKFDVDLPF